MTEIRSNFNENNRATIVMSCDDSYAPYLGICISSILQTSSQKNNYEIFILDGGINIQHKKLILELQKDNFKIIFINAELYINKYKISVFKISGHFTIATYYRFFIPEIFKSFNKVIYIDCDTIVNHDLFDLTNLDLNSNYFAATKDIYSITMGNDADNLKGYFYDVLKMKDHQNYFQAGLMVWNIDRAAEDNLTERLIARLIEIKKPKFVDQCVLNSVCEGNVLYLPQKWNYTWHWDFNKNLSNKILISDRNQLEEAKLKPFMIHYSSPIKPWKNPELEGAHYFWKHARNSQFYEEIIYTNLNKKINHNVKSIQFITVFKYYFYSVVSLIFLNKYKKYILKKEKYNEILKK